jgi:hypothetical protein
MISGKTFSLSRLYPYVARLSFALLLAGSILSILWSIIFSTITITIPYQIEFREGAALAGVRLLLSRENPYTLEHQPMSTNVYGLGYNLSVLPFAALFGNTLLVHRAVTFSFILFSAAMIATVVYKTRRDISLLMAVPAFVMTGLIGHAGIGAFPSAAGTFLFLAAVFLPFLRSYSKGSLALSMALALAAFYTKPYFVAAIGIVASFLFLFISKKAGILYALSFLFLLAATFIPVRSLFPLYFFNSIIINTSMSWLSYPHMWEQLSNLLFTFLPVLALSVFFLAAERIDNQGNSRAKMTVQFGWDKPLFNYSFDYCLYVQICTLLVFIFVLGRHMGTDMNYAYQLIVPTFFCWFFSRINFNKKFSLASSLLVVFTLLSWQTVLLPPRMLEQRDSAEWARLFSYVHSSTSILNSPAEASEVISSGLMPIDTGQTMMYYQTKSFQENPLIASSYETIFTDGVIYTNVVDKSIQKQRFDTVISVEEKGTFYHVKWMENYYSVIDEIQVEMPQASQKWTLLVWKPK